MEQGEGGSAFRWREAAMISRTRVNQHGRIYIIFSRAKRGEGAARAADKNTFVISLMVVPFYRFSVRHTPPQLDVFWWRPFNRSSTELRFLGNCWGKGLSLSLSLSREIRRSLLMDFPPWAYPTSLFIS